MRLVKKIQLKARLSRLRSELKYVKAQMLKAGKNASAYNIMYDDITQEIEQTKEEIQAL